MQAKIVGDLLGHGAGPLTEAHEQIHALLLRKRQNLMNVFKSAVSEKDGCKFGKVHVRAANRYFV